jgi:hypothetical protein
MAIDNVQAVLSKQIGTNKCDIVTVAEGPITGDYYCAHFPVETEISDLIATNITSVGATEAAFSNLVVPAGTTLFLNITEIEIASGMAMCYYTQAQ